jgi:nucleoid-associated protein YgaU
MDLLDKAADLIKPAKASLVVVGANKPDGPEKLECMFNPEKYSLSQTVKVTEFEKEGPGEPRIQYRSTSTLTLSMELLFDDFASAEGDVTNQVGTLLKWQQPTPRSGKKPRPPLLSFSWGNKQLKNFKGTLTKVDVSYTMFRRDGTPIQARVGITLQGSGNRVQWTNPTSHSLDSRRIHTLVAGETLQSVAWDELGDATYWRAIAELNGIDDPLRIAPGRTLLIPTVADAARVG